MVNFINFINSDYQYFLEKGSKKAVCPGCGKRTFVRYMDQDINDFLPEKYGRCDREVNCGYHLNPYKNNYNLVNQVNLKQNIFFPRIKESKLTYFNQEEFEKTLIAENYDSNVFIRNLAINVQFPFDISDLQDLIDLYLVGTVTDGYMKGGISFPFIDIKGNVRAVQVKTFDKFNHTTDTNFLHKLIDQEQEWLKDYNRNDLKVSCLFGEHLLGLYPNNPVALVEAPKTALYGTLYFGLPKKADDFIWLAVYNKSSFKANRMNVLKGRDVFTFPDCDAYKDWELMSKTIESEVLGIKFIFSDYLEKNATEEERSKGLDLADFLIQQDWRGYRSGLPESVFNTVEEVELVSKMNNIEALKYFDFMSLII